MIEDKENKIKIAENSDEAFWTRFKENNEKGVKDFKNNIEIAEWLIKLADIKLEVLKNGKK